MRAKNADEAIRIAGEKGFALKPEDFKFNEKSELDPEELKNVAGGKPGDVCKNVFEGFMCGFAVFVEFWD